jgi:hypothetical protein
MAKLINHWYWGRAQAGDYSIVASYIFAEKAYGNAELPIFMLAKGGKIIADDGRKVRFHLDAAIRCQVLKCDHKIYVGISYAFPCFATSVQAFD